VVRCRARRRPRRPRRSASRRARGRPGSSRAKSMRASAQRVCVSEVHTDGAVSRNASTRWRSAASRRSPMAACALWARDRGSGDGHQARTSVSVGILRKPWPRRFSRPSRPTGQVDVGPSRQGNIDLWRAAFALLLCARSRRLVAASPAPDSDENQASTSARSGHGSLLHLWEGQQRHRGDRRRLLAECRAGCLGRCTKDHVRSGRCPRAPIASRARRRSGASVPVRPGR
jgi:hypothetical protein